MTNTYSWPLMKDTMTFCDRVKLATFVMTADRFTQGEKVAEFEAAWSKWLGASRSLYVSSGSTANYLLLDAVKELYFPDRKKMLKVLVPACTWVTNVNPVFQLGMEPIFCDVNLWDFSFSEGAMKEIARKHKIDIVFTTHLLGIPANLDKIKEIFPNAYHLSDVCESHGASAGWGSRVGATETGSTFSFYFGHHMSTIEGGMVSTSSDALYDLMRMKRSHGMSRVSQNPEFYSGLYQGIDPQFLFVTEGYNFRNTEIGAVLGISQLKKLDGFIEKRRKNYDDYLMIMYTTNKFYEHKRDGNSSFCFPLIARDKRTKANLLTKFKQHGIEYRPVVGGNLLRQPYLKKYNTGNFPNADIIHENGVYIGNNQFVGQRELGLLEKIIKEVDNEQ